MAQTEPSDKLVREFLDMGFAMDEREAIARLKANNCSIDAVISELFDNPDTTKYQAPNLVWDATLHEADRDGNYEPGASTGFQIQSPDEVPSERPSHLQFGGGASKVPSRVPSPHPSFGGADNDDDPEMRRAIAASLGKSIDQTQEQESGITDSRAVFGPAQRDTYDGNWEMVLSSKANIQATEPEPASRKRDLGAPAFLKPGKGNHCLGALLTIYHEIPLLREMFLDRLNVLPNYGSNNEWWAGKPLELPVVSEEEEPYQSEKEFKHELQRLMAFLDKTERSYGSVDTLANLQAVKDIHKPPTNSLESATLEVYRRILRDNPEKYQKLFSRPFDGREETHGFAIFELEFPSEDSTDETIYDLADAVMWPGGSPDLDTAPYISHIAEVVSFQLTKWTIHKKTGVTFPAVWYPDRYLQPAKEAAWRMRSTKPLIQTKLKQICDLENKLTGIRGHAGKSFTVREMFDAALQHDTDQLEGVGESDVEDPISLEYSSKTGTLSAQLVKLLESIDHKVARLNEEKERCKAELRDLSKLYTEPSDDPNQPSLHRYTLRGVCTDKNTVYICRQAEPSLIDIDLDLGDDGSKSNNEQWWRINYASMDPNPVSVEKTTEERVLEAACFKSESGGPLVVYASDKAMQWASTALPPALESFVKRDNALFKSEFPTEMSSPQPPTPKSPGKRKFDERSDTSDDLPALIRASPERNRNLTTVSEKEISGEDDLFPAFDPNQFSNPEVTLGIDPAPNNNQEMQERGSMRMMPNGGSQSHSSGQSSGTIDNMDLDHVVEDDDVAAESKAVRHVDFR